VVELDAPAEPEIGGWLPRTFGDPAVQIARLEPSDGQALRRFFFRLSPQSLYRRFLSPISRPEQARPERLLDVDRRHHVALVGVVDGEIVGVARYVRQPDTKVAELAVVVADEWQRKGIASRLLSVLAETALAAGIEGFAVTMHADNYPMLRLIRRMRPAARLALSDGVFEGMLPLPWRARGNTPGGTRPAA
jgi:GNAT superfamily N-acetyltransferase